MGGALTYVAQGLTPVIFRGDDEPMMFSRGGLVGDAGRVRKAGRRGDDRVVHMSQQELDDLSAMIGAPTTNPETGLPEFWSWKKAIAALAPLAIAAFAPGAGTAIGTGLGASGAWADVLGNAIIGGGVGGLANGKKGALWGAGTGALSAAAMPILGNAFGTGGQDTIFGQGTGTATGDSIRGALGMNPSEADAMFADSLGGSDGGWGSSGGSNGGGLSAVANAPVAAAAPAPSSASTSGGIMDYVKDNPKTAAAALAMAAMSGGIGDDAPAPRVQAPSAGNVAWNSPIKQTSYPRKYKAVTDPLAYYNYGTSPFEQFDDNALTGPDEDVVAAATGGYIDGDPSRAPDDVSGYVSGGDGTDDGRADTIDAKLSHNEYVVDAETVALLGNGSPEAGAQKLDDFRRAVRAHKGKALAQGKISPDAKDAVAYLSATKRRA
jgi:hypothetical protein